MQDYQNLTEEQLESLTNPIMQTSLLQNQPSQPSKRKYTRKKGQNPQSGGLESGNETGKDVPPKEQQIDLNKFTAKEKKLIGELQSLYAMIATALMPFYPGDALLILGNAEECAKSWVRVAKVNKSVADTIEKLVHGTAWGSLIMVHAGLLIAILTSHGVIPGMGKKEYKEGLEDTSKEPTVRDMSTFSDDLAARLFGGRNGNHSI